MRHLNPKYLQWRDWCTGNNGKSEVSFGAQSAPCPSDCDAKDASGSIVIGRNAEDRRADSIRGGCHNSWTESRTCKHLVIGETDHGEVDSAAKTVKALDRNGVRSAAPLDHASCQ